MTALAGAPPGWLGGPGALQVLGGSPVLGGLRVLRAPRCEPPFDDERDPAGRPARSDRVSAVAPGRATQDVLPLTFALPGGLPAVPPGDAERRWVEPAGGAPDGLPAARGPAEDPATWACRRGQGLVEVLSGVRPLDQLRWWTTDEVYARIRRQRRPMRVGEPDRGRGRHAGVRVRAVRVCRPADGVAEASAVVDDGRRARAVALRMETHRGRWRVAAYEQG
jgi:hypothetical protein